jgi:hypothetical protein
MPLLGLHMTVARDLAQDIASPVIDADRGAFYLGATAPDIRVLTRASREDTHFFTLDDFDDQSGVQRLFDAQPELRAAGALPASTASFMAGYLSHLVLDEEYITRIYRPLFGERSDLRDDALAAFMDRALQCEMDDGGRADTQKVDEIRCALLETAVEVTVGFIARDTLLEWRTISAGTFERPLTLDRFVRRQYGPERAAEAERFMTDEVPAIIRRTHEHVGDERIREYLFDSARRARATIEEYLS